MQILPVMAMGAIGSVIGTFAGAMLGADGVEELMGGFSENAYGLNDAFDSINETLPNGLPETQDTLHSIAKIDGEGFLQNVQEHVGTDIDWSNPNEIANNLPDTLPALPEHIAAELTPGELQTYDILSNQFGQLHEPIANMTADSYTTATEFANSVNTGTIAGGAIGGTGAAAMTSNKWQNHINNERAQSRSLQIS